MFLWYIEGSLCIVLVNKTIHYVLANSLTWLGVHLLFHQWFNQTLCVSYYTEMILGSNEIGPVNKIRQNELAILLDVFMNQSVMYQWK